MVMVVYPRLEASTLHPLVLGTSHQSHELLRATAPACPRRGRGGVGSGRLLKARVADARPPDSPGGVTSIRSGRLSVWAAGGIGGHVGGSGLR